jgi:hypothetical protein
MITRFKKDSFALIIILISIVGCSEVRPSKPTTNLAQIQPAAPVVASTITLNSNAEEDKGEQRFYIGITYEGTKKLPWKGGLTVLRAIMQMYPSGWTTWANWDQARLTRTTGEVFIVNLVQAEKNPALDLPVYPDDEVEFPYPRRGILSW